MNAPTAGPTWERIRAALASLHPGQRRVADLLLALGREELARASVGDVAKQSATSPATVVRTCQELGFSGFRECAMLLALDVGLAATRHVEEFTESGSATSQYLRYAAADLVYAAATLDHDVVVAIAEQIARARRVLVVAHGWSAGAAATFALNLSALGCAAESPVDQQVQVVAASGLGTRDVCVVICFSGSHRQSQLVAQVAQRQGAGVILISTFSRSLAAVHADHNLIFSGRGTDDTRHELSTSSVVQFATLDALRLAIAKRLGRDESTATPAALPALIEGALVSDDV